MEHEAHSDRENQKEEMIQEHRHEIGELRARAIREGFIVYDPEGNFLHALAPNGKPSRLSEDQWCEVRSRSFKEWFGDWEKDPGNASGAVDENGEPVVCWHGSPRAFDSFSEAPGEWRWLNRGHMFFDDRARVVEYAQKAKSAFAHILRSIYEQDHYGQLPSSWQEVYDHVLPIWNEIVGDLIEHGEQSRFFQSRKYSENSLPQTVITYKNFSFGTESALEIFGGELPNAENVDTRMTAGGQAYAFGKNIGEHYYPVFLNIRRGVSVRGDTTGLDAGFESIENFEKDEGVDGGVVHFQKTLPTMGGREDLSRPLRGLIAFDAHQIKSAEGNSGLYQGRNASIYE
ncbi:MAG TPA: hypothetical protein VLB83_03310 [Candidatus Paceibacterota bacterium]|nr:hypothetical protein [Candidatus Paceibacterota bacterium]